MNSFEKELNGYLNRNEKFSGMDAYAEGDYESFDDGQSYFDDGQSYADGGHAAEPVSEPYVLQYFNSTASDVSAILFGFNDYFGSTNYGNPTAAVITNLQGGSYGRLVAQTQNKPFKIGKWRFICTTASQLTQTLTINFVDGNGNVAQRPFNLSVERDSYQQQSDILDVTKPLTVDGNTYITFTLKASATLTIVMYPVILISQKAKLNGGHGQYMAKAPRLSGRNAAPVIIQTSQGVQGIGK